MVGKNALASGWGDKQLELVHPTPRIKGRGAGYIGTPNGLQHGERGDHENGMGRREAAEVRLRG